MPVFCISGGFFMDRVETEIWETIKKIIAGGETAVVSQTKDGIKVYEQKRRLLYGKSALKKN